KMKKLILKGAMVALVAALAVPHAFAQTPAASTKATAKPEPSKAAAPKAEAAKAPAVAKELLDINTATQEQLEAMPAVGKAYAAKIIAGRPYKAKSELTSRKIIPGSVYGKIKNQIIAKQ